MLALLYSVLSQLKTYSVLSWLKTSGCCLVATSTSVQGWTNCRLEVRWRLCTMKCTSTIGSETDPQDDAATRWLEVLRVEDNQLKSLSCQTLKLLPWSHQAWPSGQQKALNLEQILLIVPFNLIYAILLFFICNWNWCSSCFQTWPPCPNSQVLYKTTWNWFKIGYKNILNSSNQQFSLCGIH